MAGPAALSIDDLFVFMLVQSAFAVPRIYARRVLLYGITPGAPHRHLAALRDGRTYSPME
ncbi:hypothetical protein C1I98_17735 [Spongiactinospora gelatinilytica]|uniref:Uncharacterized protein n=1 Tax=Spongiactinospora gelatinilytica TaxID=2666298 RepID=A0A2W2G7K2_9ACTN|nr:hypothetical protein [Spongiactinospora gelatinilytica]PZG44003.1 hypothetical protein C1I98_17735 [Spongiactinospora gelatinilytica]